MHVVMWTNANLTDHFGPGSSSDLAGVSVGSLYDTNMCIQVCLSFFSNLLLRSLLNHPAEFSCFDVRYSRDTSDPLSETSTTMSLLQHTRIRWHTLRCVCAISSTILTSVCITFFWGGAPFLVRICLTCPGTEAYLQ